VLLVALGLQVALAGGLIALTVHGFPIIGGGGGGGPATTASLPVPRPRVDRFDARRALALAAEIVRLGPRPAGSATSRRVGDLLLARLPGARFEAVPGGLRNVLARVGGAGAPIVVIAHYDTTPVRGYVGANNSAAAVGAVVELTRWFAAHPAGRPLAFLLTDGEEAPEYPPRGDFAHRALRGSRAAAAGPLRDARAVVVLDFIGQRGLRIPREASSDPGLWARLRAAARAVGTLAVFPDRTRPAILDDHTPFLDRDIPAIDLIDFDYPCWQRTCDTLDRLSLASIDAAGETVLELVRELRLH
jgi:glutaminyl-peptide cyclotransferase